MDNGPGEVLEIACDHVLMQRQKTGRYPDKKQIRSLTIPTLRFRQQQGVVKPGEVTTRDIDQARERAVNLLSIAEQQWGYIPSTGREFKQMPPLVTTKDYLK